MIVLGAEASCCCCCWACVGVGGETAAVDLGGGGGGGSGCGCGVAVVVTGGLFWAESSCCMGARVKPEFGADVGLGATATAG